MGLKLSHTRLQPDSVGDVEIARVQFADIMACPDD